MITNLLLVAENTIEELVNEGQWINAGIRAYTDSLGPSVFFGLFLLGLAGAFVMRNQSFMPIAIFALILFTLFMTVIPPTAFGLVMGVIVLVGASILYRMIVRERRT